MIDVNKLAIRLGDFSLSDISFTIPTGQYCVLMGKTGCGKTSILESICGLNPGIVGGRILLNGEDVTYLKPAYRGIGYVPQDKALFPSMTVREHFEFALQLRKMSKEEISKRVDELSALLETTHLLDRTPHGLSGGEAQRVALGRALSAKPAILCLDEPLSAVDEETQDEMLELLKQVQKATGVTVLHITHNRKESEYLADISLRLERGVICETS